MIVPSKTFQKHFANLDPQVQRRVVSKVEEVDRQLRTRRHERLQGRPEYKLRVGDWRVLYDFDLANSRHAKEPTRGHTGVILEHLKAVSATLVETVWRMFLWFMNNTG